MPSPFVRLTAAVFCATALSFPSLASAQSGPGRQLVQAQAPQANDAGRGDATKKRTDEIAEVASAMSGPAASPECVWLGQRAVSLLWRDDLDTAFRHLDLYDRFGCPGGHVQASFRCVLRHGYIDPKATESVKNRVLSCWINPELEPAPPAQTPAAAAPAQPSPPTPPAAR